MIRTRMRVQYHGYNRFALWLYRSCPPLSWLYYFLVRTLLTRYLISDDNGRTWRVFL